MTKNKKVLIIIGLIILISVIGFIIYAQQKDEQNNQAPTSQQKNCTTYNGAVSEQCTEDYIGMPLDQAKEKALKNRLTPKVGKIDGKDKNVTFESNASILFEVNNNVVTYAYFVDDIPNFKP
jgi:hypothetical protein